MKKVFAFLLTLVILSTFCIFPATANDGAKISLEVLEAGFCTETVMGYIKNQSSFTHEGAAVENTAYGLMYLNASDGTFNFVVKANITNISDSPLSVSGDLAGTAEFAGLDSGIVKVFPHQEYASPAHTTLLPGKSTPAVLVCGNVSESDAKDFESCTISIGGLSLCFTKDEIITTDRICFDRPAGLMLVDGEEVSAEEAALILEIKAAAEKAVEEAAGETEEAGPDKNAPVAIVEDCSIENIQADSFVLHTKVRNISDRDFNFLTVLYQLLDEDGDTMENLTQTIVSIPAGAAIWTGDYVVRGVDINEVHAISYSGCTYKEYGAELSVNVPLQETTTFYVSDLVKNEECTMGDTISSDLVNITLKGISYEPYITHDSTTYFALESDMIFAMLELEVENVSRSRIDAVDVLNVSIDFRDGFLFNTTDYESILLHPLSNHIRFYSYGRSSRGDVIGLSPLTKQTYTLAIPCAKVVSEDTESSLSVKFVLPKDGVETIFTCVVR